MAHTSIHVQRSRPTAPTTAQTRVAAAGTASPRPSGVRTPVHAFTQVVPRTKRTHTHTYTHTQATVLFGTRPAPSSTLTVAKVFGCGHLPGQQGTLKAFTFASAT